MLPVAPFFNWPLPNHYQTNMRFNINSRKSGSLCLTSFIDIEFKVNLVSKLAAAPKGTMSVTIEKVGHRGSMEGLGSG